MPEGEAGQPATTKTPVPEGTKKTTLSAADLRDKSRFQFKVDELELPELTKPGEDVRTLKLTTLSVDARDALPDLVKPDGTPDSDIGKLAEYFAACVCEPKVSAQEAAEILGEWPATALDKVLTKFAQMAGATKEEEQAAAGAFPGSG